MDLFGFSISQIATFLLVLARVGGIFTTGPVFGSTTVAPMVRVAIAVALTFVFLPMASFNATGMDFLPFTFSLVKELLVGLVMGFLASLMFSAIQMAGAFIDLQMGLGMAQLVDPMTKEQTSIIGQIYNLAATLLFLAVNGHHMMIRGLHDSFNMLPLGQMAMSPEMAGNMMNLFAGVFVAALKIGAPVVGAVFLTDVALGILARTVPQLNVFVVGFPAKIMVGLLAVIIVMPVAFAVMTGLFSGLHKDLVTLLKLLAG